MICRTRLPRALPRLGGKSCPAPRKGGVKLQPAAVSEHARGRDARNVSAEARDPRCAHKSVRAVPLRVVCSFASASKHGMGIGLTLSSSAMLRPHMCAKEDTAQACPVWLVLCDWIASTACSMRCRVPVGVLDAFAWLSL
jgi:hypothetical protein